MSYKNSSDVHNHLSTKIPLFPRKPAVLDAPDEAVEPVKNTEEMVPSIPAITAEEDIVRRF